MKKRLEILDNEYWWGGVVAHGTEMPLSKKSRYKFNAYEDFPEGNPFNGIFVSSAGRYIYAGERCAIEFCEGVVEITSENIDIGENLGNLKTAFHAAAKKHFKKSKKSVPKELLVKPQFCTWAEMGVEVTQEKILEYADSVKSAGFPYGTLIVDDGWMVDYGDWRFDEKKFSDPKSMIKQLHEVGFSVELWLVPFVSRNAADFDLLEKEGALVRDCNGETAFRSWWNGESAVLDMSSPFAETWLKNVLFELSEKYEVDGFKFDAGSLEFYKDTDKTFSSVSSTDQTILWAQFANRYRYSELRESYGLAGQHFILRLNDKCRNWDKKNGIGALVPNMIQAGLCGYPFSCADMIGGGQIQDFVNRRRDEYDFEVISRFCECSALMPCMQFSHAYWKNDCKLKELFLKYAEVHDRYKDYISLLIDETERNYSPVLRNMEYEFPHQGYGGVNDMFMLGDKILAAPVFEQGVRKKKIRLPKGCNWKYMPTGQLFVGGENVEVSAEVGELPYFERV